MSKPEKTTCGRCGGRLNSSKECVNPFCPGDIDE